MAPRTPASSGRAGDPMPPAGAAQLGAVRRTMHRDGSTIGTPRRGRLVVVSGGLDHAPPDQGEAAAPAHLSAQGLQLQHARLV